MLNKKHTLKVGDNVWVYLNRSKLHSGLYDTWQMGKVVGFTNKRIKCETEYAGNREKNLIANYLPKNVKLYKERA
tara:strand:- start:268 stop:492 length:225 start_codon:yes stop_codon:yes gene_type:complete